MSTPRGRLIGRSLVRFVEHCQSASVLWSCSCRGRPSCGGRSVVRRREGWFRKGCWFVRGWRCVPCPSCVCLCFSWLGCWGGHSFRSLRRTLCSGRRSWAFCVRPISGFVPVGSFSVRISLRGVRSTSSVGFRVRLGCRCSWFLPSGSGRSVSTLWMLVSFFGIGSSVGLRIGRRNWSFGRILVCGTRRWSGWSIGGFVRPSCRCFSLVSFLRVYC